MRQSLMLSLMGRLLPRTYPLSLLMVGAKVVRRHILLFAFALNQHEEMKSVLLIRSRKKALIIKRWMLAKRLDRVVPIVEEQFDQ